MSKSFSSAKSLLLLFVMRRRPLGQPLLPRPARSREADRSPRDILHHLGHMAHEVADRLGLNGGLNGSRDSLASQPTDGRKRSGATNDPLQPKASAGLTVLLAQPDHPGRLAGNTDIEVRLTFEPCLSRRGLEKFAPGPLGRLLDSSPTGRSPFHVARRRHGRAGNAINAAYGPLSENSAGEGGTQEGRARPSRQEWRLQTANSSSVPYFAS